MNERIRFELKYNLFNDSGCWEWQAGLTTSGYGQFWDGNTNVRAHRKSWEIYVGPIPEGKLVLHKCNNRKCVNINHLYIGDHEQNMKDRDDAGHTSKAEHRYNFKRNEALIDDIIQLRKNGAKVKDICKMLGIGWTTYYRCAKLIPAEVNEIAKRRNYSEAAIVRESK